MRKKSTRVGSIRQERIDQQAVNKIVKSATAKTHLRRKQGVKITAAGPRGFRLGPVWLKSIAEVKGAALKSANLPKLLATADVKGVTVPRGKNVSQRDVVEALSKAL